MYKILLLLCFSSLFVGRSQQCTCIGEPAQKIFCTRDTTLVAKVIAVDDNDCRQNINSGSGVTFTFGEISMLKGDTSIIPKYGNTACHDGMCGVTKMGVSDQFVLLSGYLNTTTGILQFGICDLILPFPQYDCSIKNWRQLG